MTADTFKLSPNMTASNTHRLSLLPAALNRPQRHGHLVPLMIPASQVYYWERIWQEGELESAGERAAGRVERFGSSGEVVRWLLTPDGED